MTRHSVRTPEPIAGLHGERRRREPGHAGEGSGAGQPATSTPQRLLRFAVVVAVAVNLPAASIELAIELPAFTPGQFAVVGVPIDAFLRMNRGVVGAQVCRFTL